MTDHAQKKIGIIACSGEELPEGTVTRMAALRVLEQLRPSETVTICLPLFLAGGEGDRAFAKFYPTIAIDGCEKRCAYRATEKYSNQPAAGIVITDLIKQHGLDQPQQSRNLDAAGIRVAELAAIEIAEKVDELLGRLPGNQTEEGSETSAEVQMQEEVGASCSCGSGIPVQKILVNGQKMSIVALPLIFQSFSQRGKKPNDGFGQEIMEMVKIYNQISPDLESDVEQEIVKEYTIYLKQQEIIL